MIRGTLYAKLALGLLAVLALLAAAAIPLLLVTTRLHYEEVTQKLDRDLAAHLVAEEPLIREGRPNGEALARSFHWLMVINPAIEIYLLDPGGRILAYSAPPERVRRERVSLAPVARFLAGERLPIAGDDPRHPERQKVFSAAAIGPSAAPDGFLYVVLGGEQFDGAAARVRGSLILRLAVGALGGGVLLALAAGLLLLGLATRRLRRLDAEVAAFEAGRFAVEPAVGDAADGDGGDEIDRLAARFRRLARRIVEQIGELKRADLLRRELVANVSHDLRTPLATLQGYLETLLLKEDSLPPERRRRYLEVASRQAVRLGKLVNDLFELAKLEACAVPVEREPFSLAELVQDVVQKFQLAAEGRRVRLAADLGDPAPWVFADIRLIERVLENLLDNALRHTPAGGEVRLAPTRRGERVTVTVSDTGCGIPAEELPFLFERFYQARRRPAEAGGGGLGLAIAKRILDLHDGCLAAESRPGAGTTFRFELAAAEG